MSKLSLFKVSFLLCLLFLPAFTLSAQGQCLGLGVETTLSANGDSVDTTLEEGQNLVFLFEARFDEVWRLDAETEDEVSFRFYLPHLDAFTLVDAYYRFTTESGASESSTAMWFELERTICLVVRNQSGEDGVDVQFNLHRLDVRGGELEDADGITTAYGNNVIGNYYFAHRAYGTAYDYYQRAIEIEDDEPVFWSNSCSALYRLARYEEALSDCNEAIDLDSEHVHAYVYRASTYNAMGQYSESLADYERLIELEPGDYLHHFLAGIQNLYLGNADDAIENMEDYSELIEDENEEFWIGFARMVAGDYDEAAEHLRRSVRESVQPPAFDGLWLALNYQLAGRQDDAEAAFEEADDDRDRLGSAGEILYYNIILSLIEKDADDSEEYLSAMLRDFPYPHQSLVMRLYVNVFPQLYPDDPFYVEMRDWLNGEYGMDS